jgi:flagellar assembly protein FliH
MSTSKPPRPAPPPRGASPAPAAAPAAKPSAYSRFIPREELNGFAAWKPGALSGAEESSSSGVQRPEPPAPPAAPTPSPAELMAEHVRQARTSGYQDGYRDGLVALEGFKQSFATQMTAQIGTLTQSYLQQLDALHQDMARALAVSATHLARQMVRTELTLHPELVVSVAQEAVDTLLLSARHITLRVNPDDHALVAQGAADVLSARGARLLSDPTVLRGGCVVESDIGVIDASLETRWRRAAATLGCDQGWDGVTAPIDSDDEEEDKKP